MSGKNILLRSVLLSGLSLGAGTVTYGSQEFSEIALNQAESGIIWADASPEMKKLLRNLEIALAKANQSCIPEDTISHYQHYIATFQTTLAFMHYSAYLLDFLYTHNFDDTMVPEKVFDQAMNPVFGKRSGAISFLHKGTLRTHVSETQIRQHAERCLSEAAFSHCVFSKVYSNEAANWLKENADIFSMGSEEVLGKLKMAQEKDMPESGILREEALLQYFNEQAENLWQSAYEKALAQVRKNYNQETILEIMKVVLWENHNSPFVSLPEGTAKNGLLKPFVLLIQQKENALKKHVHSLYPLALSDWHQNLQERIANHKSQQAKKSKKNKTLAYRLGIKNPEESEDFQETYQDTNMRFAEILRNIL